MKKLKINLPAVLLCSVMGMAISAGWYGLFSEEWMAANQLDIETINSHSSPAPYIIAFISTMITMYVLAWIFLKMGVQSPIRGALTALIIGIAFFFVVQYTQNSFSFRPRSLSFIDGGVNLLIWTVAGGILGAWRKYV